MANPYSIKELVDRYVVHHPVPPPHDRYMASRDAYLAGLADQADSLKDQAYDIGFAEGKAQGIEHGRREGRAQGFRFAVADVTDEERRQIARDLGIVQAEMEREQRPASRRRRFWFAFCLTAAVFCFAAAAPLLVSWIVGR